MVLGCGLRGYGLGFRVQGLGLIGLRVSGAKLRVLRVRERERRAWVFPPFSWDPRTTHPQPQHLSPNPNPKNEVPAPNSETQVLNHKLKQLGFQGFFWEYKEGWRDCTTCCQGLGLPYGVSQN